MAECQYCGGEWGGDNPGALAAHERACDQNPSNQPDTDPPENDEQDADAGGDLDPADDTATDDAPEQDGASVDTDDLDEPEADDTAEVFDDDNEVDGDPDAGEVDDDLADDDADDYNCGSCGTQVDYLGGVDLDSGGKACPECGERLLWSRV
jgi:DNA-directed RNA polymerase subunit RPC12/RpoP